MSENKFGNISLEKAAFSDKERKRFIAIWKKRHKVVNWAFVVLFLIGLFIAVFVSIFPIFSIKYKLAQSSFEKEMENKIIKDYYASPVDNVKLPFLDNKSNTNITDLNEELQSEASALAGRYGVYINNLKDGREYALNSDDSFTAASLDKLFLASAYYHYADIDPGLMVNEIALEDEDRIAGNGSIYGDPTGTSYKPVDLIQRSLRDSDNTAFAALTRNLGLNRVNDFISSNGFYQTDFVNNNTSPKDIGSLLSKLYYQGFTNKDYKQEMIGFMENTAFEDRLPFYLPGVTIAHKIGTWDGAYSDAGIVFGKTGDYIIVVMTENANYEEAINFTRKLSEVVYNYFNS